MRFSTLVLSRSFFRRVFGRDKAENFAAHDLNDNETAEAQESCPIPAVHTDPDILRARGFLKHNVSYQPPDNLKDIVESTCRQHDPSSPDDHLAVDLGSAKFAILAALESKLGVRVPNSALHRLRTGADLLQHFSRPLAVVVPYEQLARQGCTPRNVHVIENCVRYNPERDGPPAMPKRRSNDVDPRFRRLYPPVRLPTEWHEKPNKFDCYTTGAEPQTALWSQANASRLDSISLKKPKF